MIEIRRAESADAAAVAAIARETHDLHATALPEVFQPGSSAVVAAEDIARLSERPGHVVLVALLDGEVAGYAHAEAQETPASGYKRASAMMHVHAMGVTADRRGRGVGHSLLMAMRREAAQRGLSGISLEVYGFNEAAHAFYAREGFAIERQRLVWTPGAYSHVLDRAMRAPMRGAPDAGPARLDGFSFTGRLRAVLDAGQQEARRLQHEYIGTEHLLLSLMREREGVAAAVFESLAVDRSRITAMIEATVKRGKGPSPDSEKLPFTSRVKKVIELAMAEAREQSHSHVGVEHLLMGLMREQKGIAAQVLAEAGMRLDDARREMLRLLDEERS